MQAPGASPAISASTLGIAASPGAQVPGVPQRELRLLVDGIREWLGSLAHEGRSLGFLGLLEGEAGQGQAEILGALREVCSGLGIRVLWARATRDALFPPGAIGDLAEQCLEALGPSSSDGRRDGTAPSNLAHEVHAELARVVRSAGDVCGASLPTMGAEFDRSRLVDAIARSLIDLSAKNPLLLILEDLEYADSLTLEALHHLLRILFLRRAQGRAPRILLIATVPPDADVASLVGLADVPAKDIEAFRLRARGLSREDLRDAAVRILGEEGPLSFRERIFRLAGGNARHLRWLLWHARERGGLDGEAPRLPDTELSFERLVKRRFSELAERERLWVALLAALGTRCRADLPTRFLGKYVEGGEPLSSNTAPADSLAASGWLTLHRRCGREQTTTGGSDENGAKLECAVCDADVAAIVLDGLSDAERKRLHAWLAEDLRRIAGAEASPESAAGVQGDRRWLPFAFRQARLAGDWSTCAGLGIAATRYLEGLGCHEEALGLLDEILESAPQEEVVSLVVQIRRAELLCLTRNYREAIDTYKVVLEGTQEKDERGRICRLIGDLHGRLCERELQVSAYGVGLSETQGGQASLERLKLLAAFARTHLEVQELDRSLAYLDQCIEVAAARQLAADADYPEIYRLAEEVHFHRGDYVEAGEFERCLLKGCEERGDIPGQLQSLQHLAHLHSLRGEREESEAYLLEAVRLARSSGSRLLLARVLAALGQLKREQKDTVSALRHLKRANAIFLDFGKAEAAHRAASVILGLELEQGLFVAAAASAHVYTSGWLSLRDPMPASTPASLNGFDAETRRTTIRQLEKKLSQAGGLSGQPGELLLLASLLEEDGRLRDAQRICWECLKRESSSEPMTRARTAFALGRMDALLGDYEGALQHFEQALETRGAQPSREILAEAYLEVSLVFLARGDLARAFEYSARGVRLALEEGETLGVLKSFQCMTAFLAEAGMFPAAVAMAESLDALARAAGLPRWELAAHRHLVSAMSSCRDCPVPTGLTARWVELSKGLDIPAESCLMKLELGWDCFQKRSFTEALRLAREGIEIARHAGLEALIDEFLHLVGVVESASKNPRKNFLRALEVLEQALQGAESRKRLRLRWEVLQAMAAVYRERQKDDLAEEYQRRADEIELMAMSGLPPTLNGVRWYARARVAVPAEP